MMLTRSALVFVVLSAWSIRQGESSSEFNRSVCRDALVPSVAGMIVGGEVAPRDKWPWLVAFFVKRNKKFFCTGSLISERFVLTAAHCIQSKGNKQPRDPKNVNIYLGKWNLSDATKRNVPATPTEFIVHHDWNVTDAKWDADIAIAKLADDVTFSKSVQPVCLWTSQMRPDEANDGGIVVAWGKTEKVELSDVSREAYILRIPIFDCYKIEGLSQVISKRGLCIGGNGTGRCSGDSGGGLFTARGGKWFLRGITSMSRHNAAIECDEIFTNVEKFVPWIDQVLDGEEQMKCQFREWYYGYRCHLQNSFTRRDTKIFQVSGSHTEGRTNADVRWLQTEDNSELKFLPIALGPFFPNLEYYRVAYSGLEQISRNNFADLPKLKELWVYDSPLKVIPVDVFYDLANLQKLWSDGNQIEAIDRSMFIHNTKLQEIYLHDNKITSLDSATFRNNLELEFIDFSSNLLTSIGPELLTPVVKLRFVNFNNNPCIDKKWGVHSDPTLPPSEREDIKRTLASKCL